MTRHQITARTDWQRKVEEVGLTFHSPEGQTYWDETACYECIAAEIDELETAGNEVYKLCLQASEHIIKHGLWHELGIPTEIGPLIANSWNRDDFTLYGRFDFAWYPGQPPKLLEFNADTPTSLVEAAVAQWYWLQEKYPNADQFNSIHEKLINRWISIRDRFPVIYLGGVKDNEEDERTVAYIRDTCHQAKIETRHLFIDDVGFHTMLRRFVDLEQETVEAYFKLFPWEWMWHSDFSEYLKYEVCQFIEPMWKMTLSNKGLLPVLWKLFPGHPNLLPAAGSAEELQKLGIRDYVQKPKLSREGANVTIMRNGNIAAKSEGEYGEEGYIYQALAPTSVQNLNYATFGVWMVGDEACGLGIREDSSPITGNRSRFIPHYFKP